MKPKSVKLLLSPITIGLAVIGLGLLVLGYKINERLDRDIFLQPRGEIEKTPADYGLEFEEVLIKTADDIMLHAWYIPGSSDAGIVVSPGYKNSVSAMLKYAAFLHNAGYNLIIYCPRGQGISDGKIYAFGAKQYIDIEASIDFLKSKNITKIALFGHSNGAVASLIAASKHQFPEIFAVVADSPFANLKMASESPENVDPVMSAIFPLYQGMAALRLGFDVIAETDSSKIINNVSHVYFIHGLADQFVTPQNTELLYKNAQEPKEFWLVEGADHVKNIDVQPDEYARRILEFLGRYTAPVNP